MTEPCLFLATPTRDGKVEAAYAVALANTIEHVHALGWRTVRRLGPPGAGDIFIARNILEEAFFASEATHLFFLDSDMAFAPADVERIVRWDRPLVGAYYVTREHDWTAADGAAARGMSTREASARMRPNLVLYPDPKDPTGLAPLFEEGGKLVEASYLGGGFLCIRRDCLEKMRRVFFEERGEWMAHRGRRTHMLFEPLYRGPERSRCGEDVAFCLRWRELGEKVWCDTLASFEHVGSCAFPSPSLASSIARKFALVAAG